MIEIISGTNRPECNALKIAKVIQGMYEAHGVKSAILNLQDLPAEIFNPSSYKTKPESFRPMQDRVLQADGLHIVTPEYNGGFPGVLKYFIDMLKFPESFEARPVAFTGEAMGIWGAIRPVEQLQHVFGYRNAFIFPKRVFIDAVHTKLDASGKLTAEEEKKLLEEQTKGFAEFASHLKNMACRNIKQMASN